jgi:hypothetical protein
MKHFTTLLRACLFLVTLGTDSCQQPSPTCQLRSSRTLAVVPGQNGEDKFYAHYVLLEGFSRECLDSATVVALAATYRDTVSGKRPIDLVFFYSSADRFPVGVPSAPHLDADCLVKLVYDHNTSKPNDFIFYTEAGDVSYWGNRWFRKKQQKSR